MSLSNLTQLDQLKMTQKAGPLNPVPRFSFQRQVCIGNRQRRLLSDQVAVPVLKNKKPFLTHQLFLNIRSLVLLPHEIPWECWTVAEPLLNRCWAVASEGSTKNRYSGNAVEICPSISKPNYGDHHRQEFPAMRKTAKNYAVSIWFASTPVLEGPKFPNCGENQLWSINPTPHWKRDVHGQRREMSRESKHLKRTTRQKIQAKHVAETYSLEFRGQESNSKSSMFLKCSNLLRSSVNFIRKSRGPGSLDANKLAKVVGEEEPKISNQITPLPKKIQLPSCSPSWLLDRGKSKNMAQIVLG